MSSGHDVFDMGIGFIHTLVQKTLQNLALQCPGLLVRAPLSGIVSDAQLVGIIEEVHSIVDWSVSRQYMDGQILLRIIVALGYLCSATVHLEAGCHYGSDERYIHVPTPLLEADYS